MEERYRHTGMSQVWTEKAKLDRWITAERAIAIAGGYDQLAQALHDFTSTNDLGYLTDLREAEQASGHDVAAFVEVTERWLGSCPESRFLHYGATSSDVVDTGWALAIGQARNIIADEIRDLNQVLTQQAVHQVDGDLRVAHTHGQAAQPTEVRHLVRSWQWEISRAAEAHAERSILPGRIAGPVGDHPILSGRAEAKGLMAIGLTPDPQGTQIVSRDRLVAWLQSLVRITTACAKIATAVRFELIEGVDGAYLERGKGEVSSSSMPHKSAPGKPGPSPAERICGLAVLVRHLVQAVDGVQISWGDHTLEHSSVERVVVPQATELVAFVLVETRKLIERLRWYGQTTDEANSPRLESFRTMHHLIDQGASRKEAFRWAQTGVTDFYDVAGGAQ